MRRKKVSLLFVSLVLIIGLLPHGVFAAEEDSSSLMSAFETIRQLFGFVPEILTMEKLLGEDKAAVFWAKFLIWLALFATIYFGASFVFRQNTAVAVIVSISFSLMGALMIPASIVASIFQTYGLLAAIVIWLVPVLAGFWIAHQLQHRLLRAVIYLLAILVLLAINAAIITTDIWNINFPYFGLLLAVTIILFLWNLFAGLGDLGGGGHREDGGEAGEGWGGRARNFLRGANAGAEDVAGDLRGGRGLLRRRRGREEEAVTRARQEIQDHREHLQQIADMLRDQIGRQQRHELQDLQTIQALLEDLLRIEERIRAMLNERP